MIYVDGPWRYIHLNNIQMADLVQKDEITNCSAWL